MKATYILIIHMLLACQVFAQEEKKEEKKNEIAVVMGHAHVTESIDENGKRKWLVAAAWGLDYTYHINKKWGIGLHNDILLEDFTIEAEEKIERNYPISSCIIGSFMPIEKLSIIVGAGGEFASEGNYFLCRLGVEYGIELPKNWELSPSFTYDNKINAYNTWLLGIGIGKKF